MGDRVSLIRLKLTGAILARDGDAFDDGVVEAFRANLPQELADVFLEALGMSWHRKHEDLVAALQQWRAPAAVEALFAAATARFDYLEYDEFFGLSRKCTWALADIGTPEAKTRLEDLARHENPRIAGYARKRLDQWDQEMARKG